MLIQRQGLPLDLTGVLYNAFGGQYIEVFPFICTGRHRHGTYNKVGTYAKICWRKNLNKESDNREKLLSTFAGQIACKIHIERHSV